jgi:hypothetical protein
MSNKKNLLTVITVAIGITLTGCGLSTIPASDVKDPSSPISSRETPVTKELGCFGDMLTTYRRIITSEKTVTDKAKLIPVAVVSVIDKTGVSNNDGVSEIPQDMTDIAIGSVAKIGGALRLIHIPRNEEYSTSGIPFTGNGQVLFGDFSSRHYKSSTPTVLIYGSLTEYDRTLKNHKTGFDGSIDYLSTKTRQGILKQGTVEQQVYEDRNDDSAGISGSYADIENVSRMTMDFRIVKIDGANLIKNESVVTNTILLYQRAKDHSFGVSLNGKSLGGLSTFGVGGAAGYANTMTDVDARHAALRMLIERSVMESLGKTYNLPYWRCLAKKVAEEDNSKKPDHEEIEPKFVVRPNDAVKLSRNAINVLTTTNNGQYPESMIDKDIDKDTPVASEADLNVINAVKRYFDQDDYFDENTLIAFLKRPVKRVPEPLYLLSDGQLISEMEQKRTKIAAKKTQTVDDKTWLSQWQSMVSNENSASDTPECGHYYFVTDQGAKKSVFGEDETAANKKFNLDRYMRVDTKDCLFNQVASAYGGKTLEQLRSEYNIYGKPQAKYLDSDLFATLWLNIPIELNARWKH